MGVKARLRQERRVSSERDFLKIDECRILIFDFLI
jgi:hypothetical protein